MEQEQNKEEIKDPKLEEKELEAREKVRAIKPSEPLLVQNEEELTEVLKKHKIWMNSILLGEEVGEGIRANLKQANLAGFSLEESNLSCANLEEVSFIGAKLMGVNFSRASLKKASLQGAILKNCNFYQAELAGADFTEVEITDCRFSDKQKEEAIGLF